MMWIRINNYHLRKVQFYLLFTLGMLHFVACDSKKATSHAALEEKQKVNYTVLGDSVSLAAQKALMKQLMTAMDKGGPEYAVNFCSERAIPITDSLTKKYNCQIKRVALLNRNPANALSPTDRKVFDEFALVHADGNPSQSKIVSQQEEILYYKPILLAMPACLKCHGKSSDLDPLAYATIKSKYPADKAVNFNTGDLRGMWRIAFKKDSEVPNP